MRLFLSISLLLTLTASCSTWDRLTNRSDGAADRPAVVYPESADAPTQQPAPATAQNPVPYGSPGYPQPTTAPTAPPPPPGAGVVLPRDVRTSGNPPAGIPTQRAPDVYAQQQSEPEPYRAPAVYGSPAPAANPQTQQKGTVRPNTTIVASPVAYEHTASVTTADMSSPTAAAITGLWTNAEDPDETVEFTPTHYTTFYQGELLVSEKMTFHNRCPGDCNNGAPMDIPCYTIAGPAGIDCFGIVRFTANTLELQLLGVSDQTVVYTR